MLWVISLLLGLYWADVLFENGAAAIQVFNIALSFFTVGFGVAISVVKYHLK